MANYRKAFNFRSGLQVDNDNFVVNPYGLVGIGTSVPSQYLLNVYGDTRVTGLTTVNNVYASGGFEVAGVSTVGFLTASTARVSGILTVGQLVIGNSGVISTLVGYAFTTFVTDNGGVGLHTLSKIGINTTVSPTASDPSLNVNGDANITGTTTTESLIVSNTLNVTNTATAATFSGSGALLTDIPNSATTATSSNSPTQIVQRDSGGGFNAGIITASSFVGNVTGIASTAQSLTGSPAITVASVNATGIITSSTRVLTPSIGVGTESPSADIHIRNSGISSVQLTSDSSYSTLILGKSVSPSSNNGEIRYGYNNLIGSYPYSTSQSLDIINYGADNLNFYLNPSGLGTAFNWLTNASNRAMVLTQSGNLGINSTLPTEKLTVGGGATITGNLSVDGSIIGSGANLTNLPAGELTGSLPAIDGSNLLNLTAVGSGINIEDNGSSVGAAVTIINFDSGLNVVASTGIVTVTSSAGSVVGIDTTGVSVFKDLDISGVSTFQSHVHLGDNDKIRLGDDNDYEISYDSSSLQVVGTGSVIFQPTDVQILNSAGTQSVSLFRPNGVELYHTGTKKFETTGYGVSFYGDLNVGVTTTNTGVVTATSFVRRNGTSSQYLMADGSVSVGSSIVIQDESVIIGSATTINFVGAGVTATYAAGIVTVTVGAGGTSVGSIQVQDESSPLMTNATVLNFVGAGVTASGSGTTKTITINGGSGDIVGMITDTSVAHNSIGIGSESLSSEAPDGVGNGEKNTALGYNAGKSTTSANSNNYFGYEAGYNTDTGGGNLYFGNQSGYNNTLGSSNIGIGNSALSGSNNNQNCIGIGFRAGGASYPTVNQNNIAIGNYAGHQLGGGDENVIIGVTAGTLLNSGTNNIVIGYGAQASSPSVYNEITLGGTGITSFRIPGLQSSASDGQVLTYSSSTDSIGFQTGAYGSRTEVSGSTGSIGAGNTATITITGAKAYSLLKVGISSAAWVRLYTDTTSRTNDLSRTSTTDPLPGSGVLAEVITTTSGISTFKMSPGVIGWNDDSTPSTNIYATVTNNEGSTANINVTLTIVTLEA